MAEADEDEEGVTAYVILAKFSDGGSTGEAHLNLEGLGGAQQAYDIWATLAMANPENILSVSLLRGTFYAEDVVSEVGEWKVES